MVAHARVDPLAAYRLAEEPFYRAANDEAALFEATHAGRLPVLLEGPTGGGKTRFIEHMAWRLGLPLITLVCGGAPRGVDLLGGWHDSADGHRWQDGPLTLAARFGAICYLEELHAARADIAIHSLTDGRRRLSLPWRNDEVVAAHPDFQLVVSCRKSATAREMNPSLRQRFCTLRLAYADPEHEAGIVAHESGLDLSRASVIAAFGVRTRRLRGAGLDEGASTRMLVSAAVLVMQGLSLAAACRLAMVDALGDNRDVHEALQSALDAAL